MKYFIYFVLFKIFIYFYCHAISLKYENVSIFNELSIKSEPKIIGGVEAVMENSKFMVSVRLKKLEHIRFGEGHICGGSLISSKVILTAAHCFLNYEKLGTIRGDYEFIVVMGSPNRFIKTKNTLIYEIRKIINKMFSMKNFSNDIGLIIIKGSIASNHPTVKPINLARTTPSFGISCEILGWGVRQIGNTHGSATLLTANISLISKNECLKAYGNNLKTGMLCAGVLSGGIDSCQGDSGGPLVCNRELVGIVSWGEKCAVAGWPGIYSELSYYRSWIFNSLKEYQKRFNDITNSSFVVSIRRIELEEIKFGNGHFCSGSFYIPDNEIESNLVVTSAFCIYFFNQINPQDLVVVFNTPNRYKKNLNTRSYSVTTIQVHEQFDINSADYYNIAILKLNTKLTKKEIDVPLLNRNSIRRSELCHTYSWNAELQPFYQGDEELQMGTAVAYNLTKCNEIFQNQLKEGMFCAGNLTELQEELQADPGGALICNNKLTGIMLQRFDSALFGYPSIYTEISYFNNWLSENKSSAVNHKSVFTLVCLVIFYISTLSNILVIIN